MSAPTFASLFCGAGGDITGFVEAGLELVVGANHWDVAIDTVSTNHPDGEFLCVDINHYDMRRLPHTDVLWASVLCTEISPAGGSKKRRGQGSLDFEELGHVPSAAYERTRACALDVIRAMEIHRYKVVVVENVVEFARDWELYDWWIEGACKLRPYYDVQVINVSAAHVYGEGNDPAPQWRDRIFILFVQKGIPFPDLTPRPPAWCFECDGLVESLPVWKRTDRRLVGKYGPQYLYRCPRDSSVVEPLVLPAIAALDLNDVGERIGDRSKPLAPNTMARIEWGVREFCQPVVVAKSGNTYEAPGSSYKRAWPALQAPLNVRTTDTTDAVAWPPLIANANHDDGRTFPADAAPLPTRTVKIGDVVVTPMTYIKNRGKADEAKYRANPVSDPLGAVTAQDSTGLVSVPLVVVSLRNHGKPTRAREAPLQTVTAGDGRGRGTQMLVAPPEAFYIKNFGGNARPEHLAKPLTEPLSPITTKDHHALVIPYRKGARARPAGAEPLPVVSTVESAALLTAEIDVMDCYYRMLKPAEHFRAQRFPGSFIAKGNIGEQTMLAGNAVPCNVAHWIGKAIMAALA